MIVFDKVTLQLENKLVLDNVSFEIKKGNIAAILGPSGAGKSSILKIILGLWKPDKGNVEIDGVNICQLNENQLQPIRKKMGIVFQGNALFDSLTVEENVGYFLFEENKVSIAEIKRKVKDVLSFVNLSGTENLYPEQLSGGMKKRVAIARALVFQPEIILYDEPTAGLDPVNAKSVLDLIKKLKTQCSTSIIVTHLMNDAISIGDHLILVNEGKIVEQGTVHDMLLSQKQFVHDFFYEVFRDAEILKHQGLLEKQI